MVSGDQDRKLRDLAAEWRKAEKYSHEFDRYDSEQKAMRDCADELEAALSALPEASPWGDVTHAYEGIEVGLNKCLRCGRPREFHVAGIGNPSAAVLEASEPRPGQHEHTPGDTRSCCRCGWECEPGSNRESCARQHAEHVKQATQAMNKGEKNA